MSPIFWISFAALWLIVVIQGFAFLEVLRQVVQLRAHSDRQGALVVPDAVETGAPLPELTGLSATNLQPATWDDYLGPGLSVAVVLRAGCTSCWDMAGQLDDLAHELGGEAAVLVLLEGTLEAAADLIRRTRLDPRSVVIDVGGVTTRSMGVTFNPGAVTIRDRRLGHAAIVNDIAQIHSLVHYGESGREATTRQIHASAEFLDALSRERRFENEASR